MVDLADRVRALLGRSGLSQQEFAERIGLDSPKLSKSLGGVRRFSSLDLARIAELCSVTVDWLLTGEETELVVAARGAAGTVALTAVAEARRLVGLRRDLSSLGYVQDVRVPSLSIEAKPGTIAGDRLAADATARMDAAGLSARNEDLATAVETVFGIDVAVSELGAGFDGIAVTDEHAHLMVVARSSVPWRQRFTIAHELAHLLLRDDQGVHLDEDLLDTTHQRTPSERRANVFAAALLMPERLLRSAVGTVGIDEHGFASLACDLRVSPSALAIRLENLRLIDAGRRDRFRRLSAIAAAQLAGREADLADDIARAGRARPPGLLAADAYRAYLAGDSTLRPYAQIIGADPDALADALEAEHGPEVS